jgi:hypothetical protein
MKQSKEPLRNIQKAKDMETRNIQKVKEKDMVL